MRVRSKSRYQRAGGRFLKRRWKLRARLRFPLWGEGRRNGWKDLAPHFQAQASLARRRSAAVANVRNGWKADIRRYSFLAVNGTLRKHGPLVVATLLVIQVLLLWLSLGPLAQVSVFCTGPRSSTIAGLFGALHLLFLALLFLGLLSFRFAALRPLYAALLILALAALPVQAKLVSDGVLSCDGP
jgi:hypothetical protein